MCAGVSSRVIKEELSADNLGGNTSIAHRSDKRTVMFEKECEWELGWSVSITVVKNVTTVALRRKEITSSH